MTSEDLMQLLDELWPGNELPDKVSAELGRRAAGLPISREQASAALTEYRISSPKYEHRTPNAGAIDKALRTAAYPPEQAKESTGRSDVRASPPIDHYERVGDRQVPVYGRAISYREWCEYAKANGIENHLSSSMMRQLQRKEGEA